MLLFLCARRPLQRLMCVCCTYICAYFSGLCVH